MYVDYTVCYQRPWRHASAGEISSLMAGAEKKGVNCMQLSTLQNGIKYAYFRLLACGSHQVKQCQLQQPSSWARTAEVPLGC